MSTDVVAVGEKIHVITRRAFKEDIRRHFAGVVAAVSDSLVRAEGRSFIVSAVGSEVRRLPGIRTRIFGLSDSSHVTNILPQDIAVTDLQYASINGNLVISDGKKFSMEVNE